MVTAPALDFGPVTTTPAARHRWTTAPGGRAPRPVKARVRGKQRTLASVQQRFTARGGVLGGAQ